MFGMFRKIDVIVADAGTPTPPWGLVVAVEERYRPLVERLQREALKSPSHYRLKVLLAAALGYFVIMALVGAIFAAGAVSLWDMIRRDYFNPFGAFFVLFVGASLFNIGCALWVRTKPPKGYRPTKEEAPRLFSEIEKIREGLDGPRIHQVLVSRYFNASIVQYPRLGIFGWYRNYLSLGLPLLQAMSPDEVRAIIAHEIGHIAGHHGRFASSVYRIRMVWIQLSERLSPGWSASLLRSFFRWYGPWFNAYSFAMARSHEYEADQAAARATDPRIVAGGLIRLEIEAGRFDRYWGELYKDAGDTPAPNRLPHAELRQLFRSPLTPAEAEKSLRRVLAEPTDLRDIHPSTSDRIAALGMTPTLAPHPEHSAEEILLGSYGKYIGESLDDSWSYVGEEWWHAKYEERQQDLARLDRLRTKSTAQPLDRWDRRLHATLVHKLEGGVAALPLYDAIALEDPKDGEVTLVTSSIRLLNGDPQGASLSEKLAIDHPVYASAAYRNLRAFHRQNGDIEAASRVEAMLTEALARDKAEDAEFLTISRDTVLYPPVYPERELRSIRHEVARIDGLKLLLVGIRTLEYRGEKQQVILYMAAPGVDREAMTSTITSIFAPYGIRLICVYGRQIRWLRDKLLHVDDSVIFP